HDEKSDGNDGTVRTHGVILSVLPKQGSATVQGSGRTGAPQEPHCRPDETSPSRSNCESEALGLPYRVWNGKNVDVSQIQETRYETAASPAVPWEGNGTRPRDHAAHGLGRCGRWHSRRRAARC